MKLRAASRHQAFTLMELLIVMTIIATLVGITAAAATMMQKKARRLKADAQIQSITLGLEKYNQEYSEYPSVNGNQKSEFNGLNYTVAGARMLYQALSGDGTNAIKGVSSRPSNGQLNESRDGEVFLSAADPANTASGMVGRIGETNNYFLQDPFEKPYQYKSKGDTAREADLHNPGPTIFGHSATTTLATPAKPKSGSPIGRIGGGKGKTGKGKRIANRKQCRIPFYSV